MEGEAIIGMDEFVADGKEVAEDQGRRFIADLGEQAEIMEEQGFVMLFVGDFLFEVALAIDAGGFGVLLHEVDAEIELVHLLEERLIEGDARGVADHRVHPAFGAKGARPAGVVAPVLHVPRVVDAAAEKAAAALGIEDFDLVVFAMTSIVVELGGLGFGFHFKASIAHLSRIVGVGARRINFVGAFLAKV